MLTTPSAFCFLLGGRPVEEEEEEEEEVVVVVPFRMHLTVSLEIIWSSGVSHTCIRKELTEHFCWYH
jgi:hypothetical protein